MILIAALAPGFAATRAFLAGVWVTPSGQGRLQVTLEVLIGSMPVATAAAAGLAAVRLRRPRSALRRLARQPGAMATVAALIGAVPFALALPAAALIAGALGRPIRLNQSAEAAAILGLMGAPACGVGVATAWATLALNRRWRPEPGWIDRAGRLLGLYWLTMIPACGLVWLGEVGLI